MALGGDVKEMVMTISFLKTCISNMIRDLERKHTIGAYKRRATQIPEGPWKWFTSYELGFPLVNDKHVRPLHPLVETFVDDQLEAYLSDEEEADASQPPLSALMQTTKERWEDQTGATLAPAAKRVPTGPEKDSQPPILQGTLPNFPTPN